MQKTLAILLKEQRHELLEELARNFEWRSRQAILSNEHTYNDCALIAKMYLNMAKELRLWK